MLHLQVLLPFLFACLDLGAPASSELSVPAERSYIFLLNDDSIDSTDDEEHDREFERTKDDVRRLLNTGGSIRNEFRFNKARGFLVSGNLTEDQLQETRRRMGKRGTLVPNRKITLNMPREHRGQKANPTNGASRGTSATATCTGKTCCGRTVPLTLNANLDWLDRTRNRKYCSPGNDSTKMDVFVLDSGVDRAHPEFAGRVVSIDDCSSVGDAPWTPYVDKFGHGTHVSGIIGSTSYGVTPNVNLHMVKVLNDKGSGTDATVICGFNKVDLWLKNNPTKKAILNVSMGYSNISAVINSVTTSLATTYARRLVVVVSAGNSNKNGCNVTFTSVNAVYEPPVTHGGSCHTDFLSHFRVAVGSTGATLLESSFSNYGSCVDILAPGENILSTYPTNSSTIMSGTSMAAPLVSGVLAQHWLQNSTLTGLAIRNSISSASSALHAPIVAKLKSGTPNKLIQYKCPFNVCV